MGEFTRRVQIGEVPGPLRRAFTSAKWNAAFSTCQDQDERDKNLQSAGLLIHEKLENIRSGLKLSTSTSLSSTTKLRALLAAVNHNFLAARDQTRVAIAKLGRERAESSPEGFWVEELASIKLTLRGGFQWTPSEIVESSVDGMEIPLRIALASKPDLSGNPNFDQVEWGDIALELNLGVFFRHVEDLWDDCLWNAYQLVDEGQTKTFLPTNLDVSRAYCMGLARRLSLSLGFTVMATRAHRELLARGAIPRAKEVRSIERQGKRQIIKLSTPQEPSAEVEMLLIARALAAEPYYAEILDEPRLALGGQSVSTLLAAWSVVSRTASLLLEGVSARMTGKIGAESPAQAWLPQFAPTLQVAALVDAVSSVTGVNRAGSLSLIDFLTFQGQSGQEVWAQPLVPVGQATVVPVFGVTTSPNLRRLVDVWLRQLDVDLSIRGPAFEAHLRSVVAEGIAESPCLHANSWSLSEQFTFKPSGDRTEEIDLLFAIGSTVVVAEAKCILEPTDAKAVAMHRRTVVAAAEQARRKCDAVSSYRAEFVASMQRFGFDLPLDFAAVPLVVVSTSTHVGVAVNEVPVVDEYILGRFFEGELEDVAVSGDSYEIQKTLKTVFYSSAEEAQTRAPEYFLKPPQTKRFIEGVRERLVPLHAVSANDWTGLVMTLECVPSPSGRVQQESCQEEGA